MVTLLYCNFDVKWQFRIVLVESDVSGLGRTRPVRRCEPEGLRAIECGWPFRPLRHRYEAEGTSELANRRVVRVSARRIALHLSFGVLDVPFSVWTIVVGHATFCNGQTSTLMSGNIH